MLNPDGSKTCPRCKQPLPTTEFYAVRRSCGDGFSGYCKPCTKAKAVDWQHANPAKMADKWERDSKKLADQRRTPEGLPEKKIKQISEASKQWKKNNPVRAKEIHRKCSNKRRERDPALFRAKRAIRNNKYRAAAKGLASDFTVEDWYTLLSMFANACAFCGSTTKLLDLEHLIPLHMGGTNVVGNIVPSCRPCNGHKSCLPPQKFAMEMGVDLHAIMVRARIRESAFPTSDGTLVLGPV